MENQTVRIRRKAPAASHGPDFGDVGNVMTQQILDAVAQRRRR
jgi:hypothetical protein